MEISKWLGLKNTVAPERAKPGDLAVAKDVDVDNSGALRTRSGLTSVSATASHSMFAVPGLCLVMQGSDLKRMDEAGALTTLKRLSYGGPVSYAESNGVVYFSNGVDTGRVVGGAVKEWGVRAPVGQPAAAEGGGSLPAGRYMYAMTYVRYDGIESGTQVPGLIELADTGGIDFSGMPVSSDPDVVGRALYVSGTNGEELYRVAVIPASGSTYSHAGTGMELGPPLDPEVVEHAPAGTIVEVHAGRIYVVDGSVAWASDLYNLERFRRARSFLQLPGQIALFAAVEDGIYAATESGTWFLEGTDPASMRARKVLTYGAVPGTAVRFDGEELLAEDERTGASVISLLWTSPNGVILGGMGGQVRNLTEERYSIPAAQRGAGLFRAARGYSSYVVSLHGNGAAPSSY